MDPIETKEDESHSTNDEHENREPKEGECDNVASSTTDENYPPFELLKENIYLGNKKKRVNKEIRRMSCDCLYSPEEHDFVGCGDDCLNRLLMIECNNRCPCGESCSNRKFQEGQKTKVEAFKTLKKGWGLRTLEDISAHQFVMEYCGEVMGYEEFETRVEVYDKENRRHYYFMTLRADEIIDATHKGNLSRFINHSCSPNCETQKWTVNGYLRIGFFTIEDIKAGTELTFDYKFQRYGKKAQVCHCETPSCRGIIGGEKHTPLKSIISGRAVSPAPASSPRRNRRRQLAEQFDDKPLEIEIEQLLCGEKGIKSDEQALKLSQFMVRAERPSQRMVILDTLCATQDQNCLRSFLRYQGLSLLWSWMVDLGENSLRLQRKIVQVLKHLPVANLNQVKDSKVLKVISKWAKKPSVSGVPEEETSSSDVDSRGLSPLDLQDDAGKREGDITSSSVDMNLVRDELQNAPKLQDTDEQNIIEEDVFKRKSSEESDNPQMECDSECGAIVESENLNADEYKENDNVFEADEAKTSTVKFSRTGLVADTPGVGESSEEESRWSEDDTASTDSESITDLAAHLLDSWSNLKEVYRIPKKSTVVVKREPESTSGEVEVVTSEPASSSIAPKIPAIPLIEGDLFQKDEFLSKLGERELVERKPFQQDSTVNSNEIPPLMSTCSTPPTSELDEGVHDASKIPIHQRLQMVASSGQALKQYPVWHTKGSKKARKHPYQASGGAPKPGSDKWGARHQVSGKPRFNQPSAGHPNQPTHQGAWHDQGATAFSGSYQLPPGGIPQSSAPAGYPNPAQVQASAPPQSTHFGSSGAPGEHSFFQSQFPAQAGSGPGVGQVSGQIGIQTNPHGYQPMQQPGTQAPPLPPFDPTKPPPNFVPNQRNVPFSNTAQFPSAPSQIPNAPPSYSSTPVVPNVPSYSLPTHQVQAPITSQRTPPFAVEQTPLMPSQHPLHAVSGTPIVSSTVREAGNLDRPMVNFGRATAGGWSADSFSKQHDVPLPPDWKKAFDGEGRAYYYHVVTRQTQWDPPTVDRSPPTPELGYLGDELDSGEEMATAFTPHIRTETMMDVLHSSERKKPKTPSTPPGSPPKSPMVMKYTTAAADTTDVRKGLFSPSSLFQGQHLTTEQRKRRETFRMKLSAVVVNYLNPYHKVDCKIGRITSVDDFKFLARKLTHGVMVKELSRLKDESQLACNDSVKIKTKEYIRNYMQKFGPVYKAS